MAFNSLCASALQDTLPPRAFRAAQALVLSGSIALLGVVATLVIFYVMASPTFGWTGACPRSRAVRALPLQAGMHTWRMLACVSNSSYRCIYSGALKCIDYIA